MFQFYFWSFLLCISRAFGKAAPLLWMFLKLWVLLQDIFELETLLFSCLFWLWLSLIWFDCETMFWLSIWYRYFLFCVWVSCTRLWRSNLPILRLLDDLLEENSYSMSMRLYILLTFALRCSFWTLCVLSSWSYTSLVSFMLSLSVKLLFSIFLSLNIARGFSDDEELKLASMRFSFIPVLTYIF